MHENLGPLPEPDGWIYDGHPDGLQFRRQAITGIEALVRSSAPMFTAHQMRDYASRQLAAERSRWAMAAENLARQAEQKFPGDGTVAHWLRALVAKRGA